MAETNLRGDQSLEAPPTFLPPPPRLEKRNEGLGWEGVSFPDKVSRARPVKQGSLKDNCMLEPFETCGFFVTKTQGNHQIYKLQCSGV